MAASKKRLTVLAASRAASATKQAFTAQKYFRITSSMGGAPRGGRRLTASGVPAEKGPGTAGLPGRFPIRARPPGRPVAAATKCHSGAPPAGRNVSGLRASALAGLVLVAASHVALELPVDGPGGDAQEPRGHALVAAGVAERLLEHPPLDLLQRRPDGDDHVACRSARTLADGLRQVPDVQHVAAGEHHRALDGVLQLAHVARPGVVLERGERL